MSPQEMQLQEKKELTAKEEETRSGRFYLPHTDIHESPEALTVTLEMPGVDKDGIDINLEQNVLSITGSVDLAKYAGLEPLYAEYNVGNYTRSFTLSYQIDSAKIVATMSDGILAVKLPKQTEAASRKIVVN